jgi:hypothetical protein
MELNKSSQFEDHFLSFHNEHVPAQIDNFIEPRQMYGFQPAAPYPINHPQEEMAAGKEELHLLGIDKELRFYQEYKKIYTVSHHLSLERKRHAATIEILTKRLKALEVNCTIIKDGMKNGK